MDTVNVTQEGTAINWISNNKVVNIVNKSDNPIPNYATIGSAGMDLRANIVRNDKNEFKLIGFNFEVKVSEEGEPYVLLHANGIILVPTGIHISLPMGYEAQIRSRSGLAIKDGVSVLNAPGTIDSKLN